MAGLGNPGRPDSTDTTLDSGSISSIHHNDQHGTGPRVGVVHAGVRKAVGVVNPVSGSSMDDETWQDWNKNGSRWE